jgi:hypothetical protein
MSSVLRYISIKDAKTVYLSVYLSTLDTNASIETVIAIIVQKTKNPSETAKPARTF